MLIDPETGLKFCAQCCEDLLPSVFGNDRSFPDGLTAYCLPCKRAVETAWAETHPVRSQEIKRNARQRYEAQWETVWADAHPECDQVVKRSAQRRYEARQKSSDSERGVIS